MRWSFVSLVVVMLSVLAGCAKDRRLAPPDDSEQVEVTVKLPKSLALQPLQVMYRSPVCKRIRRGASGQRIELDGYHGIKIELVQQGQSDLYSASLAKNGGGDCRWYLANATIFVNYASPKDFGEDIERWAGASITAVFDYNRPGITANYSKNIQGDLIQRTEYYPWVKENFVGGYTKRIAMLGRSGVHVNYMTKNPRRIYFEPVLHSEFVVRSIGPKARKIGDHKNVIYPDGSVEYKRPYDPNFLKLDAIRKSVEKTNQ